MTKRPKPRRPQAGQVWYDPKFDVLGLLAEAEPGDYYYRVQVAFLGDWDESVILGRWSTDLIYVGRL